MGKYDFIALDCEKANNEPTSLCSIGLACFKNGKVVYTKEYVVKPFPCYFYKGIETNNKTTYHGIPFDVYREAPTLNLLWPKIKKLINGEIIVGHGINGDFLSIQSALEHYGIEFEIPEQNEYICTNIASIYTYPECDSHKLAALCEYLDIQINAHHALSDAIASGLLLLEMMNDTDCETVSDFIKICAEYNNIIIEKYTEKNIEKYENQIMEMFNYNDKEVRLIKNNKKIFAQSIIDYYADNQDSSYKLPNIEIITCLSPIIEISKNENFSSFLSELDACRPFTNDSFLFIKTDSKYYFFIGILIDRKDLILNILATLARDKIKIKSGDIYANIYRSFYKYKEAMNLFIDYLYYIDEFEEYDVYEFIKYYFDKESGKTRSYQYELRYNMIFELKNVEESMEVYTELVKKSMQMLAIYDILLERFEIYADGLDLPDNIFSGMLLPDILDIFENENVSNQIYELKFIVNKWYELNVLNTRRDTL